MFRIDGRSDRTADQIKPVLTQNGPDETLPGTPVMRTESGGHRRARDEVAALRHFKRKNSGIWTVYCCSEVARRVDPEPGTHGLEAGKRADRA